MLFRSYGGDGDNVLIGGVGDDVYYVGSGDESDEIQDSSGTEDVLCLYWGWDNPISSGGTDYYEGVDPSDVSFDYDEDDSEVTITIADGADSGSGDDAEVSFEYGAIEYVYLYGFASGALTAMADFGSYTVHEYVWNESTEVFDYNGTV